MLWLILIATIYGIFAGRRRKLKVTARAWNTMQKAVSILTKSSSQPEKR